MVQRAQLRFHSRNYSNLELTRCRDVEPALTWRRDAGPKSKFLVVGSTGDVDGYEEEDARFPRLPGKVQENENS